LANWGELGPSPIGLDNLGPVVLQAARLDFLSGGARWLGMSGERLLCLLSFNRPHYLRRTLSSLRRQTNRDWELWLFQDGPRPDNWRYDAEAACRCVELARRYFPSAGVIRSSGNVGIARNMLAAQHFAFEERNLPVAYFFEDDLVLHRRYLEQLFLLERALSPWRCCVPYFAAYGDICSREMPASTQLSPDLSIMDHLWGFGLLREHWKAEQRLLAPYFDYIQTVPYRERDHAYIRGLFQQLGAPLAITSQDGARAVALSILGRAALRTRQPMAHYIGKEGTHFTPEVYRQWGFASHRVRYFTRPRAPRIDAQLAGMLASCYRQGVADLYPISEIRQSRESTDHGSTDDVAAHGHDPQTRRIAA